MTHTDIVWMVSYDGVACCNKLQVTPEENGRGTAVCGGEIKARKRQTWTGRKQIVVKIYRKPVFAGKDEGNRRKSLQKEERQEEEGGRGRF